MNGKFESQKERLISIKQEISLLYQQVNYLLRNEKPLELLDLDVLMNRTHTLYTLLCAINVGDESLDEDLPFDADDLAGLFEGMVPEETGEETQMETEEEAVPQEEEAVSQETVTEPEEEPVEVVPEPVVEPVVETIVAENETPVMEAVNEPISQEQTAPVAETPAAASEQEEKPLGDEYGFFFRFEEIPETEVKPVEDHPVVETEGKVVHVVEEVPEEEIPERDRVHGDDLVHDNPLEMPQVEDEVVEEERIGCEKPASEGFSDIFEKDDTEFELTTGETLGEKMMGEDRSLAAKLQQAPGRDLRSVIGINDKFLFVNELFGGNMEKYNKSIENLDDLKTLNGAMIYLNELKIELQWNSSNEAYLKLKELVMRKFE